jgi:hypothetical protein
VDGRTSPAMTIWMDHRQRPLVSDPRCSQHLQGSFPPFDGCFFVMAGLARPGHDVFLAQLL